VILREMEEVNSNREELVLDYLHACAYQGTSLGYTILGPEENIKSISKSDLQNYIDSNYVASRMVLVGAGGVNHEELVEQAEKHFGSLPTVGTATPELGCRFTGSDIRARDDTEPLAHIAIAVEGVDWNDPDYFPLMCANTVVGSWNRAFGGGHNMASPLARYCTVHQLAHSYMSFHTSYSDTGLWGVYAVCEALKVDDFVYRLQEEWMRLCQGITDADVARAKNQLKASQLFLTDGTTAACDEIGRHMLSHGRRMYAAELDARIEEIDTATVRAAANKYIFDQDPAVVGVGPIEGLTDYNRLRNGMTSF